MTEKPNLMMVFAKNNRTTGCFERQALDEIRLAYRIMEYLAPDNIFTSTKDQSPKIKTMLLSGVWSEMDEAVLLICEALGIETRVPDKARELVLYLRPIYLKEKATAKEKRRAEILKELKELEKED